jgi:type VI secretion system protein ImpC
MATSRFAHYLKVMPTRSAASWKPARREWLNADPEHVNPNVDAGRHEGAFPVARAGRGEGNPASWLYNAIAYLRPWLQMEELITSLRMVASIL